MATRSDWLPHTDLGLRALVIVAFGAVVGLRVLDQPGLTGVAILSSLLLVLADFHGDRTRRLRVYLMTGVTGAALIGVFCALGGMPVPLVMAAAGVLAAVFTVMRSGGGTYNAAANALLADMLLGLATGMSGSDAWGAFAAALAGGVAATACAMLIRPAPWISPVRLTTLDALRSCADRLGGEPADTAEDWPRELLTVYVDRPERPATPTPAATASLDLLSDLAFLSELLDRFGPPERADTLTRALQASRQALRHPRDATARAALDDALVAVAQLPPDSDFGTRAVTWSVAGVARGAQTIARPTGRQWRAALAHSTEQLRVRLSPRATVLWSALTAAALFAALVGMVSLLKIPHPQWVFLCAISTFYPYARRAAARAGAIAVGTLAGFAVLLGLMALLGEEGHLWWIVLLVATWVSMSAPHSTSGTIYGQCAFTVLSLSMLGLAAGRIAPEAAFERMADIGLGVSVALVCVVVLAPKNLRRRLSRSLASLMDLAGQSLRGDPVDTIAVRAGFLRCTDIVDAMRGVGVIDSSHLVDWLDAARLVGQAHSVVLLEGQTRPEWHQVAQAYDAQARALRSGDAVPPAEPPAIGNPGSAWLWDLVTTQAADLALLSPLQPASRLRCGV